MAEHEVAENEVSSGQLMKEAGSASAGFHPAAETTKPSEIAQMFAMFHDLNKELHDSNARSSPTTPMRIKGKSSGDCRRTNHVVSPYDDKVMGNPIGWLQEMCMSRRWPPPSYEMVHEEGLPLERQFTITSEVLKHREVGTGKSKKLAKRMAAHKMWQALQDTPTENSYIPQSFEKKDERIVGLGESLEAYEEKLFLEEVLNQPEE
ncbi:hypothetical protein FQA39_LY02602 [Lamprigera yunnana]|nr:hypothetical protein FQA39_LY02602 [Lamprigera yunnana]